MSPCGNCRSKRHVWVGNSLYSVCAVCGVVREKCRRYDKVKRGSVWTTFYDGRNGSATVCGG